MKIKTLLIGLVSGVLLSACGGPLTEEPMEQLGTSESALCEGWDSGARKCSFKCISTSSWWVASAGSVAQNQCTEFAISQCGRNPYGVCWSK